MNLVNEGRCTSKNQQAVTRFPGPPPSPPLRSPITASPTPWDVLSDQVQYSCDEEDTSSFEKGIWTTVCRLQEVQRQPRLKTKNFELLKCSECTSLWRLQQTTREWYEKRNLCVPKRCTACRRRKQPKLRVSRTAQPTRITEHPHGPPQRWKDRSGSQRPTEKLDDAPLMPPQPVNEVSCTSQTAPQRSAHESLSTLLTVQIWSLKPLTSPTQHEAKIVGDSDDIDLRRGVLVPLHTIAPQPTEARTPAAAPAEGGKGLPEREPTNAADWLHEEDGPNATQGQPHTCEYELVQAPLCSPPMDTKVNELHGRGILFPLQTIAPHPPKALPSTALPPDKHEQQSDSADWLYEDDGNTAIWQGEPHQIETWSKIYFAQVCHHQSPARHCKAQKT